MGHLSCLQRSSRAADGTPIHLRMDGPGLDTMDVPSGGLVPKLQFTAFGVDPSDNGLERFITATRRQNFLTPPRRHRGFPLVEMT